MPPSASIGQKQKQSAENTRKGVIFVKRMETPIKRNVALVLLLTLILSSCTKPAQDKNPKNTEDNKVRIPQNATRELPPEWVNKTLDEWDIYQNVDIDGVGSADDQVYVGTYSLDRYSDDYYDGLTLIYVQLGTGEVLAKAIPCKGIYKVHFAKLLSDFGGNQIVLEITNRGSTYAASNIFVISAYVEERSTGGTDGEIKKIPEILFLLNTMGYGHPTGGTEWHEGICSDSFSMGLEIVNIEGLEQQGLQICYLAPQEIAGQKNFKTRTIYWDCGVWRVCQ